LGKLSGLLLKRVKIAVIAAITLFVIFGLSSLMPLGAAEAEALTKELEGLMKGPLELRIFFNNFFITMLSYLPFIGPCVMGYVIFHTGRYVGWLAAQTGMPSIVIVAFSILTVYGVFEFLAYGLTVTESLTISYYIVKARRLLKREIKILLICIAITSLLLAIAAAIEASLTHLLEALKTQNIFY